MPHLFVAIAPCMSLYCKVIGLQRDLQQPLEEKPDQTLQSTSTLSPLSAHSDAEPGNNGSSSLSYTAAETNSDGQRELISQPSGDWLSRASFAGPRQRHRHLLQRLLVPRLHQGRASAGAFQHRPAFPPVPVPKLNVIECCDMLLWLQL